MKIFSTFSGIGGFEIGIENTYRSQSLSEVIDNGQGRDGSTDERGIDVLSGHEPPLCVGYSEIDKYASSVYEYHFPGAKNYGDITKINEKELPDFDCLVGGFPCQAFSIAGKRRGFEDTRGTLFFDLARILRAKQPRYFVFENVKGLLSHDNGSTFRTIITTIDELGYDCQWQVLNSKNFGVPQNRERVYIVGHLRGTPRPEVFPITGTNEPDTFIRTIRTGGTASYTEKHARDIIQVNQPVHSNDRVYAPDGISPTLNTMQGGNRQPFVKIKKNGEPKATQDVAGTLTAGAHSGGNHSDMDLLQFEDAKIRRLTPVECERLQGFPDNWTKFGIDRYLKQSTEISDTQRYKMCGNAVTTNVVQAVFERIFANANS